MSKGSVFANNVEISGNIDISGDININGTLTVDSSFSLYGFHIPDPNGEDNKVLTISGEGYSWESVETGIINGVGQTFYEIITEQPRAFDISLIDDVSFANSFNSIDIKWNYDNLIPFDASRQHLNITGDLNQRVLPCITHICFDISSSQPGRHHIRQYIDSKFKLQVAAGHNYNSDISSITESWSLSLAGIQSTLTYKGMTLTNTNSNTLRYKYTVRIWGENQSNDSVVNKLIYRDLDFLPCGIPATPTIISITPTGNNTTTLDLTLNVPDIDTLNTETKLDSSTSIFIEHVDISCDEIETLRSTTYSSNENNFVLSTTDSGRGALNIGDQTQPDLNEEDVLVNVSYLDTSFNLGSKYKIQAKCINALNAFDGSNNDGFTSYSTGLSMTTFIDIPTKSDLQTSTPFNSTFTYTNVTQNGGNGKFEMNNSGSSSNNIMIYDFSRTVSSDPDQTVGFNTSGNPSEIEVSDPDTTKADSFGYGKYIDDSLNLITLECWLNDNGTDEPLHTINFNGWKNQDVSHTYYRQDTNGDDINFFTIPDTSYSDVFSGITRKEGFRLKIKLNTAIIKLQDMCFNDLMIPFDPYKDVNGNSTGYIRNNGSNVGSSYNDGYTFKYRYTHNNSHESTISQDITSEKIYIDDFPDYQLDSTSVSEWLHTVEVKTIGYIMGIPYVETFDLSINRNHYNIHSQYRYHRDDGKICELYSLQTTPSAWSLDDGDYTYLSLPTNIDDFNNNGTYNGGREWSGLNYTNKAVIAATNNTITGFQTSTKIYNLYHEFGTFTSGISLGTNKNHYFDYNSYTNYSSVFTSNSENRIYEISSNIISDLNSNFQNIHNNLVAYTNHETEIQSHTLPFISGNFTIDDTTYPDICGSFEWDGTLSTTYENSIYDNRFVGIDLTGSSGDYKWIVYKIDESNSSEYLTGSTSGVNLSYIVDKLFGSAVENSFYESIYTGSYDGDKDALLINIVGKNKSNNDYFFGRINHESPGFNSSSKWYTANKVTTSKSLTTLRHPTNFSYTGALPGTSDQSTIRNAATGSWSNTINGHLPIVILTFSNGLNDHYLYFALRK